MGGVIVANGRRVYESRDIQHARRIPHPSRLLPRDREGRPIDPVAPIVHLKLESPIEIGDPLYDKSEEITYRVAPRLAPLEGWASLAYWQDRWKLEASQVLYLVRAGLLDAAIEYGSMFKKYRCRDERTLKETPTWLEIRAANKHARFLSTMERRGRLKK